MTWLRYAGGDFQPDVNIRLKDIVGITVGQVEPYSMNFWDVNVYYSDGAIIEVGSFRPVNNSQHENRYEGRDLARARAEEIKAAVDRVK